MKPLQSLRSLLKDVDITRLWTIIRGFYVVIQCPFGYLQRDVAEIVCLLRVVVTVGRAFMKVRLRCERSLMITRHKNGSKSASMLVRCFLTIFLASVNIITLTKRKRYRQSATNEFKIKPCLIDAIVLEFVQDQ